MKRVVKVKIALISPFQRGEGARGFMPFARFCLRYGRARPSLLFLFRRGLFLVVLSASVSVHAALFCRPEPS